VPKVSRSWTCTSERVFYPTIEHLVEGYLVSTALPFHSERILDWHSLLGAVNPLVQRGCSVLPRMSSCSVMTVRLLVHLKCYSLSDQSSPEFGVYVDKHGDPSRSAGTIEWEGTAERVALHSPYILLFDSRFIEIRHIETGRLAQIISGNDIRCIWDGRGIGSNVSATPVDGRNSDSVQEAQVHAVMTSTELLTVGNRKATAQNVFELIPTVPLYLPGSLTGPPPSGVFMPQSPSPPDSPELRPSGSWRL
jgi:hypothetical protein